MSLSPSVARGQPASWRLYPVIVAIACATATALVCGRPRTSGELPPADSLVSQRLPPGSSNAYGHAVANLMPDHWPELRQGKEIFLTTWVAPGDAAAQRATLGPGALVREGLGPLFNATSCTSCHFRDGRGGPPRTDQPPQPAEAEQPATPRLLRLSRVAPDGQILIDPGYGVQLQDHALSPLAPEGRFELGFRFDEGRYSDGTRFVVQAPQITLFGLRHGPLLPGTQVSVRSPPSLIGLGLLEAITEQAIIAFADPDDADGDGISGRPNHVREPRTGARVLGRFGWKAGQPSLWLQNATALREDLGVTTSVFPEVPCTASEAACTAAAFGRGPELDDEEFEKLTRYTRLLGPPARRNAGDAGDAEVVRGEALFARIGCAGCHRPRFETGEVADLPELARQTIEPYSDLLLHDMGEALADHRPEGEANGHEWRTAPLWGLGLLRVVSGEVRLLHDGRARSPEEAIVWHGGEAQVARDRFMDLSRRERAALLGFLGSL